MKPFAHTIPLICTSFLAAGAAFACLSNGHGEAPATAENSASPGVVEAAPASIKTSPTTRPNLLAVVVDDRELLLRAVHDPEASVRLQLDGVELEDSADAIHRVFLVVDGRNEIENSIEASGYVGVISSFGAVEEGGENFVLNAGNALRRLNKSGNLDLDQLRVAIIAEPYDAERLSDGQILVAARQAELGTSN